MPASLAPANEPMTNGVAALVGTGAATAASVLPIVPMNVLRFILRLLTDRRRRGRRLRPPASGTLWRPRRTALQRAAGDLCQGEMRLARQTARNGAVRYRLEHRAATELEKLHQARIRAVLAQPLAGRDSDNECKELSRSSCRRWKCRHESPPAAPFGPAAAAQSRPPPSVRSISPARCLASRSGFDEVRFHPADKSAL